MNSLVLFISGCALFSLVLSSPQDEPNDATVVTAANTNTRLFTDDANTNNAIAGGLLGVGVGVGGVLLAQAFLDSQKEKERCQPYHRYKRGDFLGGLFGGGNGNNQYPKPCPPRGQYPPHHQAPYRPLQPRPPYHQPHPQPPYHQPPYHPPQPQAPYHPPPRPQYPQQGYPAPSYPAQNYQQPAVVSQGYKSPSSYQTPRPNYQQPAPQYPNNQQGYRPAFQGRAPICRLSLY